MPRGLSAAALALLAEFCCALPKKIWLTFPQKHDILFIEESKGADYIPLHKLSAHAEILRSEVLTMTEKEMNEVEIYTLQDEEGNEHEFELIGTCEKNGIKYYAMISVEDAEKNNDVCEYTILKTIVENGEESLGTIDDDDEFDDVADYFDDMFASEIDHDQ